MADHGHHFFDLADVYKELTVEAVAAELDIKALPSSSDVLRLADVRISFGRSNASAVMEAIITAVELKYGTSSSSSSSSSLPRRVEVFYNHQSPSSSTELLCSLPADRNYYAACVSGSFYKRLFPAASLHLLHCSDSLQWLSKVPEEVVDRNSPAWNGKRVCYSSSDEAVMAYKRQYERDMECFLNARSQELVQGGLMVIVVSARPGGSSHSEASANMILDLLGSCLFDMANKGKVSEEKVENFNLPIYMTSPGELEEAVSKNGRFSVEKMETLPRKQMEGGDMSLRAKVVAFHLRAGLEGYVKKHFGDEMMMIMDDLFQLLANKIQESPLLQTGKIADLFVLLKRKVNN